MRRSICSIAALVLSASLALPVQAGQSGRAQAQLSFAPGKSAMFAGPGHGFSRHRPDAPHFSSFRHQRQLFVTGLPPQFSGGPIVPPFRIGAPLHPDRFRHRRFDSVFIADFGGSERHTVIVLQPFAVPVAVPMAPAPPVRAQVVEIEPLSQGGVLIFSPTPAR